MTTEQPSEERFANRAEAGEVLAANLTEYADRDDVVVLGLPRGGVPVAARVASALGAPLDVVVVRKLGLPGHSELAMGAAATFGDAVEVVRNQRVIDKARVSPGEFDRVCRRELDELRTREADYRGTKDPEDVRGRTAILVDDGLATGSTMRAAVAVVRRQQAARVVVAVPAGAADTCAALRAQADEVVCARTPEPFVAVGQAYRRFDQTTDEEVRQALAG